MSTISGRSPEEYLRVERIIQKKLYEAGFKGRIKLTTRKNDNAESSNNKLFFLFFLFFLSLPSLPFKTVSYSIIQASLDYTICSQGCPQIYSDLPFSACVLGLQACTIIVS